MNANVQETISGIAIAKNFRQEAAIYHEFRRDQPAVLPASLRTGFVFSAIFPLLGTVAGDRHRR